MGIYIYDIIYIYIWYLYIYMIYIHANHSRYFTIFNISWTFFCIPWNFHSFTLVHGGKHRNISPFLSPRHMARNYQRLADFTIVLHPDVFEHDSWHENEFLAPDQLQLSNLLSNCWMIQIDTDVLLLAQAEWMDHFILMLSYCVRCPEVHFFGTLWQRELLDTRLFFFIARWFGGLAWSSTTA